MLEEAAQRYLARLLLTFSDICDSDSDIAACLTLMRLAPPPGESKWTAENVRKLMPLAYSAVSSTSEYTNQPNHQTAALCAAVFNVIKSRKDK